MTMTDKKATHVVVKSGLYYTPSEGEMKVGTQMVLSDEQAEKLVKRGFIKSTKEAVIVDASDADTKAAEAKAAKEAKAAEAKAAKEAKAAEAKAAKEAKAAEAKAAKEAKAAAKAGPPPPQNQVK